jgi:hypothetical protein
MTDQSAATVAGTAPAPRARLEPNAIGVLGVGPLVRATDPAAPPVTIRRASLKMAAKRGRDARRLPLSHSWQCRFGYATSRSA